MTFKLEDAMVCAKIPRARPWLKKRWWMVGMDTAGSGSMRFCVVEKRGGIFSPLWELPARVQRWLGADKCHVYLVGEE